MHGVPGELDGVGAETSINTRITILNTLLGALQKINEQWLATHSNATPLYQSGVRYQMEADTEAWKDIAAILKDGEGDCEDLASWRAAELAHAGIQAHPVVSWQQGEGGVLYHIRVWRASIDTNLPPDSQNPRVLQKADGGGYIEDPSVVLGMK